MQKYPLYAAGGLGLAALENQVVGNNLPDELKRVNLGLGAITGLAAADPRVGLTNALSSVPLKEMALFGVGGLDKFRKSQQELTDTNLQTARTNLSAAALSAANESSKKRTALMFLLPALLGGGGLAYYAWNKRTHPKPERYSTVAEKGHRGSNKKIRLDLPPSVLPESFYDSLANLGSDPRVYERVQAKRASMFDDRPFKEQHPWLHNIGSILGEGSGVSPLMRAAREGAAAMGSLGNGRYDNTDRYALSALGNTAFGLSSMGMLTLPAAAYLLKQPRLLAMQKGPLSSLGKLLYSRSGYANNLNKGYSQARRGLANVMENPNFTRGGFTGTRAVRRAQQGLDMRGQMDRLRDIKNVTNSKLFDFNNPTTNSWFVRNFFSRPSTPPTSLPGHMLNTARYMGNRAINAGYGGWQMAKRWPNMTAYALGMPLAGMGELADEQKAEQYRHDYGDRWEGTSLPVSAGLTNLLQMVGARNPNSGMLDQLRDGPYRDLYPALR